MCVGSLPSTSVEAVLGVVLDGRGAGSVVIVVAGLDLPNVFANGAKWVFLSSRHWSAQYDQEA
jgi:hypothetical protein